MKKTLTIRTAPAGAEAPAGGKNRRTISASRLDKIHELAREMRRNPKQAELRLGDMLGDGAIAGCAFKRKSVMGSAIIDFHCRERSFAVMIGTDPVAAERDDRKLAELGLTVLRLSEAEILADPVAAFEQVRTVAEGLRPPPRRPAFRSEGARPYGSGRSDGGRNEGGRNSWGSRR